MIEAVGSICNPPIKRRKMKRREKVYAQVAIQEGLNEQT
jgi:hypothetical protein